MRPLFRKRTIRDRHETRARTRRAIRRPGPPLVDRVAVAVLGAVGRLARRLGPA